MKKVVYIDKNLNLEQVSDKITNILRGEGYDKISVDIETNPKDDEDMLFRIEATAKGKLGNSRTKLPPIKFQIRGKPNHFLVAQQWIDDYSDITSPLIIGLPGLGLSMARSLRRNKLEKKYWKLLNHKIESSNDLNQN